MAVQTLADQVKEMSRDTGRTVFQIVGDLQINDVWWVKGEVLLALFEDATGITHKKSGRVIAKSEIIYVRIMGGIDDQSVRIVLRDGTPLIDGIDQFAFVFAEG